MKAPPYETLLHHGRDSQVGVRPLAVAAHGGYFSLRTGARFRNLRRVTLAAGDWTEFTRYPVREDIDDLVMVSVRQSNRLA